jgi:hypothetical protein
MKKLKKIPGQPELKKKKKKKRKEIDTPMADGAYL